MPQEPLADLGGGVRDARPPLGVQILSISCSFRENLACSRPPWRVHAPPRENPGSATERFSFIGNSSPLFHTMFWLLSMEFKMVRDLIGPAKSMA